MNKLSRSLKKQPVRQPDGTATPRLVSAPGKLMNLRFFAVGLMVFALLLPLADPAHARSPGQDALDNGTRLYQNNQFQESIQEFREAVELDPGLLMAWENLGHAYSKTGNTARAIRVWDMVLKVEPQNTGLWNAAGIALMENNQPRPAVQKFNASLNLDPGQHSIRLRLAKIYESLNQWENATRQYKTILKSLRGDHKTLLKLVTAYKKSGRDREAVNILAKRLSPPGANNFSAEGRRLLTKRLAGYLMERGDRNFRSQRFQQAEAAYRSALKWTPGSVRSLTNLGWSLRKLDQPEQAIHAWRRALSIDPKLTKLNQHIADALMNLGRIEEARDWYEKSASAHPASQRIDYLLFTLSLQNNEVKKALAHLARAFETPNGDEQWSRNAMNHFLRNEKINEGIGFFRKRLASSSARKTTRYVLGRLYTKRARSYRDAGYMDQAVFDYKRAIAANPLVEAAYKDLGWYYWKNDRLNETQAIWEKYRKYHPQNYLPYNLLSRLYIHQQKFDEGLAAVNTSLQLKADQPKQQLLQVKAHFWNKHYKEAWKKIILLARNFPDDVPIQYFLGEMYMQEQNFKKGEVQWKKVLDLGSKSPRAHFYWIKSKYEQGHYSAAVQDAENYLETQEPYERIIRFLIEDASFRKNKRRTAYWYQQLGKHYPERTIAWRELAHIHMDRKNFPMARKYLLKAQETNPDDLEITLDILDLNRKEGRYNENLRILKQIRAENPDNRRAFFSAFYSLKEMERYGEAKRLLKTNTDRSFFKDYEYEMLLGDLMTAERKNSQAKIHYGRVAGKHSRIVYIPILLYHGLSQHGNSKNLSIQRFEDQMRSLQQAGYVSLSAIELGQIADGKMRAPEKPILITFDDARIDAFVYGDPILEKYNMSATMFVPTGRILDNHPFFADWDLIRKYAKTGRWDIQGHGHLAHDLFPINAEGEKGYFLSNYIWKTEEGRQETAQEYEKRLEKDYLDTIEIIQAQAPKTEVVGYAFPFSESGQSSPGTAKNAFNINERMLKKHYRFGFIQDFTGYNRIVAGHKPPHLMRRVKVERDWDGIKLLRHLTMNHPQNHAKFAMGKSQLWDGNYLEAQNILQDLTDEEPAMDPPAQYYLSDIAYNVGHYREAERLLNQAMAQPEENKVPDTTRLKEKITWKTRPRVYGRFNYFSDSNDRTHHTEIAGFYFPFEMPVDIFVEGGYGQLKEELFGKLDMKEVTAGIRVSEIGPFRFDAKFRHRAISDDVKDTNNIWLSAEYLVSSSRIKIGWSDQDVDTLRAVRGNIQAQTYTADYLARLTRLWSARLVFAYQEYDDTNSRFDARGGLKYTLPNFKNMQLGVDVSYSDTEFQTKPYYTPKKLIAGVARALYHRKLGDDTRFNIHFGTGGANDKLNGTRYVLKTGGYLEHMLTKQLKASASADYSQVPGYKSLNVTANLQYLF